MEKSVEWMDRKNWLRGLSYAICRYEQSYTLYNDILYFTKIDWDDQSFDIAFTILDNCWVLYFASSDEAVVYDSRAVVAVDPEVFYSAKSEYGIFTRRYFTIKKNSTFADRVSSVVLNYIPYLSDVVQITRTLTGEDLDANRWVAFPDTYELQQSAGIIINKVIVYGTGLKQKEDQLYLKLEGTDINSVNYGFDYDVYKPLW